MTASAFLKIDKAAFHDFIQRQKEGRYEYVRGRIVQQMTGGTRDHVLIARRFTRILEDQLDASRWVVLPDRGVETHVTIRHPELVVEPVDEPGKSLSTKNPRIIVEVLSPSTSATDLDEKPAEYLVLASLDAYIVASQDEPACLVWARGSDGRFPPEPVEVSGQDAVIEVMCSGQRVTLPLAEVYRGIV